MYQKFTVESVRVVEADHAINIGFTFDVDEDSVTDTSVYVTQKGTLKPIIMSRVTVDGPTVTLEYESLNVNTDYEVVVTKDVKSIMDDELAIEFRKKIRIISRVDSTVNITTPVDYEELEQPQFAYVEVPGKSGKKFDRFRLQIASDYGFLDVIYDTVIEGRSEVTIAGLKPSPQYFSRVRVEAGTNERGNWSEPRTFTLKGEPEPDYTEHDEPKQDSKKEKSAVEDEAFFEDDFEIVGYPENGVTPNGSFIIEFDGDIDTSSIDISNIVLTRKQV